MRVELQQAFDRMMAEAEGRANHAAIDVKASLSNTALTVQDLENAAWSFDELAAVVNDLLGEAD